jgi:hypothetical protein
MKANRLSADSYQLICNRRAAGSTLTLGGLALVLGQFGCYLEFLLKL